MIYARAHDQTVAEDYFTAMQRVEQRLEIVPEPKQEIIDEDVKVQPIYLSSAEPLQVLQLIERLEIPEVCFGERCYIALQLREALEPRGGVGALAVGRGRDVKGDADLLPRRARRGAREDQDRL